MHMKTTRFAPAVAGLFLLAAATASAQAPEKKKISMTPFKTLRPTYTLAERTLDAKRLVEELGDEFDKYFTQSRRYVVLSRRDDAAVQAEEERLASANTRPEELEKFGQKLGCDVLVTGEIKDFYVAAPRTIAATGSSVIDRAAFTFAYRMVELATGEILDTDNVVIELSRSDIRYARGDAATIFRMLLSSAVLEMVKVIDPAKIIKKMKNGQYVINQGGSLLYEGTVLDAYGIEEEIVDPDTGESLGGADELIGVVQVVRVDKKISYAKLVSGEIGDDAIENGVVVRGHVETEAEKAAAAAAKREAEEKRATTGIKLPFD